MSACPSIAELDEFVASGEEDADIAAHLAGCEPCRTRVAELRADHDFLRDFVKTASTLDRPSNSADEIADRHELVPGYRLQRVCGRGGQALVYEAIQLSTRRRVALKVLDVGRRGRQRRLRRFEREIELVARLRHPHIVTVYDSGFTSDGQPYFAMEYVEGVPVNEYCRDLRASGLPVAGRLRAVLRLFAAVCDAVRHAHHQGIIHRDLKPSNVLVDRDGVPRVLDFGLARVTGAGPQHRALTVTGEFVGTLMYAAPEQLAAHSTAVDTRTDVYALGVMLYELLTGVHPYPVGGSVGEVIRNIQQCQPRPPSRHVPAIDDELSTIVLKALAKDPEHRYESAAALLDDINRYLAGQPISAKRDSLWYLLRTTARRYRGVVATSLAFVLLLIVFSITMVLLYRHKQVAEQTARRTAAELAHTLTLANVERGRLMNLSGNAVLAETLLWREHLRQPTDPPRPGPGGLWRLPTTPSYWALWELYRRNPCRATVKAGNADVLSLAFGPRQRSILALTAAGRVLRWNPDRGHVETLTRLPSAGGHLRGVFAAGGRRLLWTDGCSVVLQDVTGGGRVLDLPLDAAHPPTTPPVLSEDGGRVAIGVAGHGVLLADVATARWKRLDLGSGEVQALCLNQDGRILWTLRRDQQRRVLEKVYADTGETIAEIEVPRAGPGPMRLAPASGFLLFASQRNIGRWQLAEGRLLPPWRGHLDLLRALAVSSDGRRVASAADDKTVRLWDMRGVRPPRVLHGHRERVSTLAFSPDGRRIVSGDTHGTIKLWDAVDVAMRAVDCPGAVHGLAVDRDGARLALCGAATTSPQSWFQIRDLRSWDVLYQSAGDAELFPSVAFIPGSDHWVTCDVAGTITVWSRRGPVARRTGLPPLAHVSVSPDGRLLAAGRNNQPGDILILDAATLEPLHTLPAHHRRVPSVAFNPDGTTLASAGRDGTVILWDAGTFERRATLAAHEPSARVVRFSPDGSILATGGDDWNVRLWNGHTGRALRTLTGHRQHVFALAFSPDGHLLASGDRSAVIRLWDVASGRNLLVLDEQLSGHIMDLAFDPAGRYLLAASTSRLIVWDLTAYQTHVAGNRAYQQSLSEGSPAGGAQSSSQLESGTAPHMSR